MTAFATQGIAFVALPFYFETVLHRDPVETGFLLLPWAVVVAIAAPIAGRLSDRYPPGLLGGVGLALLSGRHGVAGAAAGRARHPRHRLAHGVVRHRLRHVPVAQPARADVERTAASQRRRERRDRDRAAARTGVGGAALVALCFGLAGAAGPTWALGLGAASAAIAALASSARLWAR